MFDISWSELLLIAVAALVFIGPKELPRVLRTIGQMTGKIRRMAGEFQDQFREAMREAEMADLKKDIDEATAKAGEGLDPFSDIKEATEWKPPETTGTATASTAPAAETPPAPAAETEATKAEPAKLETVEGAASTAAESSGPAAAPPAGGDKAA